MIGRFCMDVDLQGTAARLARLLDSPAEVPVWMRLIKREIIYRPLMRQQGSFTPHIARAVERIG